MLLINGIACVLIQLGLFLILSKLPTPADALLLQLTFSKETFTHIAQTWGIEGTHIYLNHYYLDMMYPIFYSLFLSGILKKFSSTSIIYLPFIACAFDLIENTCHILLLTSGNFSFSLIILAALCAWIKWIILLITLILVFLFWKKSPSPPY
ncbi:MAG: hypothetical protein A2Z91_02575 [Deltaproteobacteria bacterium GWA2_38_16]|nr:MAG: hypothetical protein A2Z91_02575 [Deltaproteobacteria bacterium GWA2_38_16]OGQ02078.1 MAG: hypothetical protein A3D19_08870 [Deltaproteobacteria bacterium RIFCSPHIGHO2_02_FULL_38_15]OGQ32538.1 MAG: hypothetical protein A3A72_03065 [Deltaproteobacteria bacterium RIFCSPLOWO2_01_FULL_38_9]OGQ63055.1 MAG: hypothetical protein A3G92_05365 [Deltaproteobacteria bacterium RIFCSPLOWO2_12_FULL_38_8]HBQ21616.1 hypothetical protein [Deltaproteobacteria bacterium]